MKLQRLAIGILFFLLVNAPYAAEPHDEATPEGMRAHAAMVK